MKKKLLILGGGVYQIPLILKAKEMDIETIVVSRAGKYPGFKIADFVEIVDTTNFVKVVKVAQKYKIDGAVSAGTDVAIPALGKINDELMLNGPLFQSAINSTDKIRMKNLFKKNNVPTAKFFKVKTLREAGQAAHSLNFPVMIKAINSSGSRGITKANSNKDIAFAWKKAKEVSRDKEILVEEYLNGIEFGAQTFIYKGRIRFVQAHNDTVTPSPFPTPIGHSFPMSLTKKQKNKIIKIIELGINALGLDNCAGNIDLMLVKGEPKILEIGARAGATCLPELVEASYGLDYYKLIIDVALGLKPDFSLFKKPGASAGLLLKSYKSGVIEKLQITDKLRKDKNILKISFDVKAGDKVNKFRVGSDRIGEVIVKGKTAKEAENFARAVEKNLIIDIV